MPFFSGKIHSPCTLPLRVQPSPWPALDCSFLLLMPVFFFQHQYDNELDLGGGRPYQRSASADHTTRKNVVVDPSSSKEAAGGRRLAADNQRVELELGQNGVPHCVGKAVPMAHQRPGGRGYGLVQDLLQEDDEQEVNVDEPCQVG